MDSQRVKRDIFFNTCLNILKERHFWYNDWLINKLPGFDHPNDIIAAISAFISTCKDSLLKGDPLNTEVSVNGIIVPLFDENIYYQLLDHQVHM